LKISKVLINHFNELNYEIDNAIDGEIAWRKIEQHSFDLIILDLNLPLANGFEVLRKTRQAGIKSPIIALTAFSDLDDKLRAFELGVDDYVTKPFHLEELSARVKAHLSKVEDRGGAEQIIYIEDLSIDIKNQVVKRGEIEIQLSIKEYALLVLLAKANGNVVSKKSISSEVWNLNFETGTNTIEVYVNFLRNKVDKPFDKKLIHTKVGYGYYLKAVE